MDAIIAGALFDFVIMLETLDSSVDYREEGRNFARERGLDITTIDNNWAGSRAGEALVVDPARSGVPATGINVRAMNAQGQWAAVDIAQLDRASLLRWMASSGGTAERVVGLLLGHI